MPSRRAPWIFLALTIVLLAAPAAWAADCDYDFTFSRTGSGDVRVQVIADCPGTEWYTSLSVSPGPGFAYEPGNYAEVVVEDEPGDQLYCASSTASYFPPGVPYAVIDQGSGSDCATY